MPAGFRIWAWVGWCVKPYFQRQPSILSKGHGNYAFGYNEDHATGGTFRKEKGGPGVQVGSYGLRDHDGRMRTVNYVADALGFRASISTNEPGVDPKQDPAAADINGGGIAIAAPVLAAPAPAYAAAPLISKSYAAAPILAAPIAYGAPSSYSVGIQHASIAAPILTKSYAAAPVLAASTWA